MAATGIHTIYRRGGRMAPQQVAVADLGGGVGRIDCFECQGTGWWDFMEPEIPGENCVECKGTGQRLIAFWPEPTEERKLT